MAEFLQTPWSWGSQISINLGAVPGSGTGVKGHIDNLDPFTKGTASKNFFAWN